VEKKGGKNEGLNTAGGKRLAKERGESEHQKKIEKRHKRYKN